MLTPNQFAALKNAVAAAIEAETATGCPRELTVAQWALESGYGEHLPPGSNNPFGVKAVWGEKVVTAMTSEYINGKMERIPQNFRAFDSLAAAFEHHGNLITNAAPYRNAFRGYLQDHSINNLIVGIAQHYATDPNYANKLRSVLGRKEVAAALTA